MLTSSATMPPCPVKAFERASWTAPPGKLFHWTKGLLNEIVATSKGKRQSELAVEVADFYAELPALTKVMI